MGGFATRLRRLVDQYPSSRVIDCPVDANVPPTELALLRAVVHPEASAAGGSISVDVPGLPAEPPPGCVEATMWRFAYNMYALHPPGGDGGCDGPGPFPCWGRKSALTGFASAMGWPDGDWSFWMTLGRRAAWALAADSARTEGCPAGLAEVGRSWPS